MDEAPHGGSPDRRQEPGGSARVRSRGGEGSVEPPRAVGPYTPLVRAGDWLVVSGQLGLADGAIVDGGVPAQVAQAVANLLGLLAGEGAGPANVVKTTVFLTDMADYPAMNEAYVAAFGEHRPARSAVAVAGLPLGGAVEIEAWAFAPS